VTFLVADEAPTAPMVTDYDKAHLKLYLRLLDADTEGAAWEQVARLLLDIDPVAERDRALRRHETHLARARWMTDRGYLDLLRRGL
jgi:hypothetical protein